jgi:exocyst complex component 6
MLTGRDIPILNENAIANILIDVDFLSNELSRIGRGELVVIFKELRTVRMATISLTEFLL